MMQIDRHRTSRIECPACKGSGRGLLRAALAFWGFGLVSVSQVQAENLLPVPSGQPVVLQNVMLDSNPGELWVRFRFVAPRIGSTAGRITYDVATVDMAHLCTVLAVPYVAQHELDPARVVISFSDRAVDFGNSSPDATQFFEAYRLEDATCIWDGL